MNKKGYLLIEALISIFILSILIFTLSVFLKRVFIIENIKKKSQKNDEKLYFVWDKIVEEIENRDREKFYYNGQNKNIYIDENNIIYRKNNIFYRVEVAKNKLYISDSTSLFRWGIKVLVEQYGNISFKKIDGILLMNIQLEGKKSEKIVVLR